METTVSLKKENVAIFDHSWQIIANPNALSNSCYKHWEEIAVKLDELQLDYQFYITDDAESEKRCVQEHLISVLQNAGFTCEVHREW